MIDTKLHNKALRKNENNVVLLPLHRPLWVVMVFCALEKIRGQMSAQERYREQQLVSKIKEQELIN
jgi:hypothetical protein